MNVRDQIVAAGVRNGQDYFEPGMREVTDITPCRQCGASTRVGLDAEVAAFRAVVEIHPVDKMGELTALLSGRATYAFVMRGKKWVLRYRNAGAITSKPADQVMVLVEHRCGVLLGRPLPPPALAPITFLDDGPLPPCMACGLPAVTSPCSTCRRAYEPPRPIAVD